MPKNAYLEIQIGMPHPKGTILPLKADRTLIGRMWHDHTPDIHFDDLRISRSHVEIYYEKDGFFLRDLPSSKHGTEINGEPLIKGQPHSLSHNDEISLAKGVVQLRFCHQPDEGMTLDLGYPVDKIERETPGSETEHRPIVVNENRREVLLDGRELAPRISGREFDLIALLYRNRGKAVSHEEIINWVWRNVENRDSITRQDVNTLIYRLRNCLGEYGPHIVNISSYGYRLD